MGRGPIKVPDFDEVDAPPPITAPPEVVLPDPRVVKAAVDKFIEMANLHWPGKTGLDGYRSVRFDINNLPQLHMAIGLAIMAADAARRKYSGHG